MDDVIKDLGCEAAVKDSARDLKRRLAEIKDPDEDDIEMAEWNEIVVEAKKMNGSEKVEKVFLAILVSIFLNDFSGRNFLVKSADGELIDELFCSKLVF